MHHAVTRFEQVICWLDGGPYPVSEVGGKGASLNRLRALGAPVPLAAAIPTTVYQAFARRNGIPLTLDGQGGADPAFIRETMLTAPLPDGFAGALMQAGQTFATHGRVAVRSSATAEDSVDHAFAGLHDTVLNVDPGCNLEQAVRQCWASLWSDRAISYRREQGLRAVPMDMAVVVQAMVSCDVSFVGFAVDPITEDSETVLITATWGLGEAVVAGLVVPDEIRVDRSGQIADYRIGGKHQMVIPSADGVRSVPVPRVLQSQPVLSPDSAREIAAAIRALSAGLGYAADVEGGISNGALHFFQARPITTLSHSSSSFPHLSLVLQEPSSHVNPERPSAD